MGKDNRFDINKDGVVDTQDRLQLINAIANGSTDAVNDVNNDGVVDSQDLVAFDNYQKNGSTIDQNELTTITIGSDVKFKVKILGNVLSRTLNILSVDAYFINKDLRKLAQDKKAEYKTHFKFLRRYPLEPMVNDFRSTVCCLNNPGRYGYNVMPVGTYVPVYSGYGVKPLFCDHCPKRESKDIMKAVVCFTADRNVVELYVPAYVQQCAGEYDLVLKVKVYDASNALNQSRTFTQKYNAILKITDDSYSLPGGVSGIEITNATDISSESDSEVEDLYVTDGLLDGSDINLLRTDGSTVNIDVSSITDWYEG